MAYELSGAQHHAAERHDGFIGGLASAWSPGQRNVATRAVIPDVIKFTTHQTVGAAREPIVFISRFSHSRKVARRGYPQLPTISAVGRAESARWEQLSDVLNTVGRWSRLQVPRRPPGGRSTECFPSCLATQWHPSSTNTSQRSTTGPGKCWGGRHRRKYFTNYARREQSPDELHFELQFGVTLLMPVTG